MRTLDPNNFVDQMRLHTGDYLEDEEYLDDAIYVFFYNQTGHSVIDGSILALESIINNIALSPSKWQIGDASESAPIVGTLVDRLTALKQKRKNAKVPVVISSDRKNWCDFDKAFGSEYSK